MRICWLLVLFVSSVATAQSPQLAVRHANHAGTLTVLSGERELLAYQYDERFALPHIWPLRSPSGKLLTEQHPDPFPHHRSLWIAERVLVGDDLDVDFYHCWKNYREKDDPKSGYRHFIKHQEITSLEAEGTNVRFTAKLQWIVDDSTPVIDEIRTHRVVAFDKDAYLLDLKWELTPTDDREDVVIVSDWVHYAWPYLRIHPQFSGEQGGTIVADNGSRGQEATTEKYARWIDYFNTVEGETEGVAVFPFADDEPVKWLTREYGTFGPRRPDRLSGKRFAMKPGEPLTGRVGILVHSGDVDTGRVAKRYQQFIEGEL